MADGERSAKEREAARLERERRRSAQSIDPLDRGGFDGGAVDGDRVDGSAVDGVDGDGIGSDRFDGDGVDGDHEDEFEAPIGIRRVARRERPTGERGGGTPAARRRPIRSEHRYGRRRSFMGAAVGLLALVPLVVVIWFAVELFQPFSGSPHGRVTVTIPPHSGAHQVGDLLASHGVVPSGFFFNLRALLSGDRAKLRAGTYTLKLGMSYSQALTVLITPPPAAKVSELTLVEGRTRAQTDALLRSEQIGSGYLAATRHSPLLNPSQYGAPPGTDSLEGFLFPSTYQLRDPISIQALVADQLKTFRARFATVNLGHARSRHLTPYDLLIIASLVQAEAQAPGDFPKIASVIYNRLADHMPLQLDATTRYATGNYTTPLTQSQLSSPSPYNTRNHPGLTPTPIDNPGMEAIDAAANPASTNYLYFVVKPCGNGSSAFASSYAQFQTEVAQYYSARSQHGGKSPTHC